MSYDIKQEPTDTSKQPIKTRYLDHVTGYQPIRDQYFLIRSVPDIKHSLNADIPPQPPNIPTDLIIILVANCFDVTSALGVEFQTNHCVYIVIGLLEEEPGLGVLTLPPVHSGNGIPPPHLVR
eukprot:sb/3475824/